MDADGRVKAHRRVKSLVKDLEEQPSSTMTQTDAETLAARPRRSLSRSPSRPNAPASYEAAQNSLAFSSDRSPDKPSFTLDQGAWAAGKMTTSPEMSLSPKTNAQSWGNLHNSTIPETPADEKEDIFLPMSPISASSPYQVAFPNSGNSSPFAPTFNKSQMLPSEQREHSRRHSRIHSRNLSVFFPHPADRAIPEEQDENTPPTPDTLIRSGAYSTRGDGNLGTSQSGPNARRGHHHKHSLSHNFYQAADQLQLDLLSPTGSTSASSSAFSPSTPTSDTPRPVPSSLSLASSNGLSASLPVSSTALSLRAKYAHLPTLVRFTLAVLFHLPFKTQCALGLSATQIILGSALWIYGQSGESLAVTGLGYLIVFDGLGALSSVVVEGNAKDIDILWDLASPKTWNRVGERAIRYPFGTYRLSILSQFAQCIFLLFSAVYVCKESVEHVLLLHEPHAELTAAAGAASHGSAHGSMGHGEVRGGLPKSVPGVEDLVELGVTMPTGLLLLSTLLCLATAVLLRNHASLTEAVGPTTYALRPRPNTSRNAKQTTFSAIALLLSNPFSLLVFIFSAALSFASIAISGVQLAPLDKVLALLESLAMFYVAYPAAEATGKVLLQTAPPPEAGNMMLMKQGLKDVEAHPLVVAVAPPRIWQLTPHPRQDQVNNLRASTKFGKSWRNVQRGRPTAASVVVATVKVTIRSSASDRDLLEMTHFVREKCAPALRGGEGQPPGELTVVVKKQEVHGHSHSHAEHSCGNDHHSETETPTSAHSHSQPTHSHSHAHSHDHSHAHS